MTTDHTYKVPPFTVLELVSMRVALKHAICRFWHWRKDPVWREHLRTHVTAYRKLQQQEVVQVELPPNGGSESKKGVVGG